MAGLLARPRLALRGLGADPRPAPRRRHGAAGRDAAAHRRRRQRRRAGGGACATPAGREQRFECDAVGLGWHLRAETQLADLARCEFEFEPASRQWLPRIDADGRSSTRGVYLAGDGARILGRRWRRGGRPARRARGAGRPGPCAGPRAVRKPSPPRCARTLAQMDRFRAGLARAFPWPHAQAAALPDDAIVCRCEAVTAGELRRCVNELDSREVNRAKAFSRVGMGRCQGRFCGHAAAEIVAQALRHSGRAGRPPAHAGAGQAADDGHARGAGMSGCATHDTRRAGAAAAA